MSGRPPPPYAPPKSPDSQHRQQQAQQFPLASVRAGPALGGPDLSLATPTGSHIPISFALIALVAHPMFPTTGRAPSPSQQQQQQHRGFGSAQKARFASSSEDDRGNGDDDDDDEDEETDGESDGDGGERRLFARGYKPSGGKVPSKPRYAAIATPGRVATTGRAQDDDDLIPDLSVLPGSSWVQRLAARLPWWCPPRALFMVASGAVLITVILTTTLRKIHNRNVIKYCVPAAPMNVSALPRIIPGSGDDRGNGVLKLPPDPWAGLGTSQSALDAYVKLETAYRSGMTASLAQLRLELSREINARSATVPTNAVPLQHWRHSDGLYYALRDDVVVRGAWRGDLVGDTSQTATGTVGAVTGTVVVRMRALLRLREKDDLPAVGLLEVSPDGTYLAIGVDRSGNERFDVYIWDMAKQRRVGVGAGLAAKDAYYTARWLGPSTLVVSTVDALGIPRGALRVAVVGADTASPGVVSTQLAWDATPERTLNVLTTSDESLLVLQSAGQIASLPMVASAQAIASDSWTPDSPAATIAAIGDPDTTDGVVEVEHLGGYLYMRTNLGGTVPVAGNFFEVVRVPYDVTFPTNITNAQIASAQRLWPHTPGVLVEKMEVTSRFLVLWVRVGGRRELRWRAVDGTSGVGTAADWRRLAEWDSVPYYTAVPGFASDIGDPSSRVYRPFDATTYQFTNSSPVHPSTTWDLDLLRGGVVRVTGAAVPATPDFAHNPSNYARYRVWVKSADVSVSGRAPPASFFANPGGGDYVPVDLAWRLREGEAAAAGGRESTGIAIWQRVLGQVARPLVLHAYGAYASMSDATFDAGTLALMDRGLIVAVAHPRGDGDLGPAWYRSGSRSAKANTYADVDTVVAGLQASGIAEKGKIALMGRSAGGLVAGTAVAASMYSACSALGSTTPPGRRPWDGVVLVVAQVPFVDLAADMADVSVPWTEYELPEWGDPRIPTDYTAMLAASPYDALAAAAKVCHSKVANRTSADTTIHMPWPAVLVSAGRQDARVPFAEPVRWIARLRHVQALALGAVSPDPPSLFLNAPPLPPGFSAAAAAAAAASLESGTHLNARAATNSTLPSTCRTTEDVGLDRPAMLHAYAGGHFSGQDAEGEAEWMAVALNVLGVYDDSDIVVPDPGADVPGDTST
ncbi:hypothetical protein BC828DRAFT_409567 [Blastocladiella britannica]|nr:hypothetical protein BC828DRAFT_409567 [Blastocladiella britannica]